MSGLHRLLRSPQKCHTKVHVSLFQRRVAGVSTSALAKPNRGLSVRLPKVGILLDLKTGWVETCDLSFFRLAPGISLSEAYDENLSLRKEIEAGKIVSEGLQLDVDADGRLSINAVKDSPQDPASMYLIKGVIPEFFSLDVLAARGRITLARKLKGDCTVRLDEGDIHVDIIRGASVRLATGRGSIVADELEGKINVTGNKVKSSLPPVCRKALISTVDGILASGLPVIREVQLSHELGNFLRELQEILNNARSTVVQVAPVFVLDEQIVLDVSRAGSGIQSFNDKKPIKQGYSDDSRMAAVNDLQTSNADASSHCRNLGIVRVRVKLINGSEVHVNTMGEKSAVKIGGLYAPKACITSAGNVDVSTFHGAIDVYTSGSSGAVSLSSVNGSANVSTGEGDVEVHMENLQQGTYSNIRSGSGDVAVTMSTETTVHIEAKGKAEMVPANFVGIFQPDKVEGRVTGSGSMLGSDSNYVKPHSGRGKISLVGAREQSLRNFSPQTERKMDFPKLHVTAAEGSIRFEVVSWADNLIRKIKYLNESPQEEGAGEKRMS